MDARLRLEQIQDRRRQLDRLSNKELLLQNKDDLAADMFLIYVLTLSVFPGFLSEDNGSHSLGSWYVLVLIATYNAGDLVGRCLPLARRLRLAGVPGAHHGRGGVVRVLVGYSLQLKASSIFFKK